MWSKHSDCKSRIPDCWSISFVGFPMYILTIKLKLLKEKLKPWNKNVIDNVHVQVTKVEEKLKSIQNQINIIGGHFESRMNQEKIAQLKLDAALVIQEYF